MKKKLLSLAMILAIIVTLFGAQTVYADGPEPLDLTKDTNNDDIPDELAAAVQEVLSSDDPMTAGKALSDRLPYAPETRALQNQVGNLQDQLNQTQNALKAQKIMAQISDLQQQMMEDPNYAITVNALDRMLASPTPADEAQIDQPDNRQNGPLNAASWNSLLRGHVLLIRSGGWWQIVQFMYAIWYGHAGIYDGSNNVYESNADGVRIKPLSNWRNAKGAYVGLGKPRYIKLSSVEGALNWAKTKYGNGKTPYNYNLADKNTDARLYCSQLVWKIYMRAGTNLDSNNAAYIAYIWAKWGPAGAAVALSGVAPDEIDRSPNIIIYSGGWN